MSTPTVTEIDPRTSARECELRARYARMRPLLVINYRVAGMTLDAKRIVGAQGFAHALVIG